VSILEIIILLPLLGALAIALGLPVRLTAILAALASLILAAKVALEFDPAGNGMQFASSRVLLDSPKLALAFGVDGMSLVMLLLTVIVTFCAVWMCPPPRAITQASPKLYYISVLLIAAGGLGAFLSTDLFFFYAFHELALIPTFLMIGMLGYGADKVNVAWRVTIYLGVGSLVLLAGLLALMINIDANTFDIATLQAAAVGGKVGPEAQKWIFLTLLVGFGTLISLFPFHSWAAPAYAAAPAPVAMLHAGVLKKFGLYGLMRVAIPMLPAGFQEWTNLIAILLVGNILYIGLVTIAQRHLDRMLGYSSVMHMGYVFLGILSANVIGTQGAIMLMFAHGVGIALLFGLTGQLRNQLTTLDMETMGGLGKNAPFLCFTFALAAFASVGLPGFANFASEVMVFFGAFESYAGGKFGIVQIAAVLSLWGVVISAVYMLRGFRRVFQGSSNSNEETKLTDPGLFAQIPVYLLLVVLLAVGCYPKLVLNLLPGGRPPAITTNAER